MNENLIAKKSVVIKAPADRVWKALTSPDQIKQYLFGTDTITDWKPGSPIKWKGEWQGKTYEDKGKVLAVEPGRLLRYTYWSSMSGKDDKPENYATVTTEIAAENGQTRVTIIQDGNENEKSREHSEGNWATVLEGLKNLVEKTK
jgi:uncharacterized protein YndB with AHSA1/START domain